MNYLEALLAAKSQQIAIGAFNIFNEQSTKGVLLAVEKSKIKTAIIQTSVKTVKFYGPEKLYNMYHNIIDGSEAQIFLHLDHCKDIELAKACVDAGWDSVMYDGSALPFEENVANTRIVADYAHEKGIFVEGELGKICGVEEDIVVEGPDADTAKYDESIEFVERSGVDTFAPAIGTAHGVYKGVPKIDFALVERLSKDIKQPVVIHGGTGLSEETFLRLINNGGCKVNVSTALKNAYFDGVKDYVCRDSYVGEPLKLDENSIRFIEDTVSYHIRLFGKEGK